MMGVGGIELIVLLLAAGGGLPELAAVADPAQYFEARQVEVTFPKMAALAAAAPRDGKAQMMQLLALRYLGENADKFKKAESYAAHRAVLEAIADGKNAQDPQGFAKEYAQRALAQVDGKDLPLPASPALAADALSWFPADATIVAALDTRPLRQSAALGFSPSNLFKKLPPRERLQLYEVMEQSGNVRVDRIAFAYVHDDKPERARIMVRFTGKANREWVVSAIRRLGLNGQIEVGKRKDAAGKEVTVLQVANEAPVFVLAGDTDMVIAGYSGNNANHGELADAILAVRDRKKPNVSAGPLKARLGKVPQRAAALLVGDIPGSVQRMFGGLLQSAPLKVDAHLERVAAGLDVSVTGTMANAGDAQTAVTAISKMRKEGIDKLQQILKQPDAAPGVPANALINLLQSLQMQSEGNELRVRLLVPHDVVRSMPGWFDR